MWLKQKIYILKLENESNLQNDNFDEIQVKLNRKLTTIKLSQLFAKISSYTFSEDSSIIEIKGWSILQQIDESGRILIGEDIPENYIEFSFQDSEENEYIISEVNDPWIIFNDIELSEEELEEINNKILELSKVSVHTEDEAGQDGSPHTSPPVIINETYNRGKVGLIKKGFKEFSSESDIENPNFRLLIIDDENKLDGNLIEFLSEDKLYQVQNPVKVTDGFYKFEDEKNQRIINAKIIDGILNVSFSDVAIEEQDYENIPVEKNDDFEVDL